jgi:hypothetical protein
MSLAEGISLSLPKGYRHSGNGKTGKDIYSSVERNLKRTNGHFNP